MNVRGFLSASWLNITCLSSVTAWKRDLCRSNGVSVLNEVSQF